MEYLKIENFKCFYSADIPINGLTILCGANGNGKSTVIQALLLLRSTVEHCTKWNKENKNYELKELNGLNVELNGNYCLSLGNSNFIIPKESSDSIIKLGIFNDNEEELEISYDTNNDDKLWLVPFDFINESKNLKSIFKQEFYYLNAERIGPRIKQNIHFFDFPTTGSQGEFVAQLLGDTNFCYKFEVEDIRRNINSKNPRFEQQVNAWLDFIMPGVSVIANYDINTLSAQIKIDNNYIKGEPTIAPNIGFGISYILPIIVTGLIAKKDSYMIVENPEAHLHPSAQSKIGQFLAMVASTGVKVIVETHSDHLVNGVQIATALNKINSDLVTINFFSYDSNLRQPDIESISINNKGELSNWPKDFFDQSQRDFTELFKIRKR